MSEPGITREDLEQLVSLVDARINGLEHLLNGQEELVASLMVGYAEVSSALETLIQEFMSPRSDEEKQEFRRLLDQRHADTLQMIKDVSDEVARTNPDDPTQSILGMAARQHADSSNEQRDGSHQDHPNEPESSGE